MRTGDPASTVSPMVMWRSMTVPSKGAVSR